MTVIAVVVFVVAYVLIATEWTHKLLAALGGAAVLLALGVTDSEHAFYSHDTGIDWDVIFLLLGMMIIVGVLRRTGVFEYVAIWAAKRAKGSPLRVMILLTLITAVASAFLDNVTTVLLIAPVTLLVCDRLGINPVPFLIAEVMASNIGGTATLIGDPPNIIIASRSGLTFNDFLIHMTPLVVIALVVFTLVLPRLFRGSFAVDPDKVENVLRLNEREAIQDTAPADQVRRRAAGRVHRVRRARGVPRRALGRRAARGRPAGADLRRPDQGLHVQRRVADPAVLRRPVHHGRRPGQDRRDRRPRQPGRRTRPRASRCWR